MSYTTYNIFLDNMAATPKNEWTGNFKELVSETFYNSSDWFTIQEESTFGSGVYSNVDVRVNYVFSPTTGINMGDDWKLLMFPDTEKYVKYGSMFYFDNNYWVTVNVEAIKNLTSTCIIRRCNNSLRWLTPSGEILTLPCVLDYSITENRNYASAMSAVVNPSGILQVISQLNSSTNKIQPNQRFLFGNSDNWSAYKVQGGGIRNYHNQNTLSNSTQGLLNLTLSVDFVNEDTDDLTNGIANINQNVYSISISGAESGEVGTTSQLVSTVYLNGNIVDRTVTWASDDTDVATVNSSGLVSFLSSGTANITATLNENTSVSNSISVETLLVPATEYVIAISPNTNVIYEGDTTVFTVSLYLNSVVQADTFAFTLVPNTVPSDNYVYSVIDGNNFSIKNVEMFLTDELYVQCVSGVHSKTFGIKLLGAW